MTLTQQLQHQWQQSRQQLAANPRLGWGLWCLVIILLLYANLVLRDNRDERALDLYSLQQRAAELGVVPVQQSALIAAQAGAETESEPESDWPARLAQANAALTKQEVYFGQAESEALARADVQASVNSLLVASGLERSLIEVSTAPAANASSGLVPLQLKISGQARGDQLLTLLGGLEHTKPSYAITSLNALQSINSEHLNYSLLATVWYQPFESTP